MSKKKRDKTVLYALIGAVLFFAVLFAIPGLTDSIGALVTGQQVSCNDAPFNPNCYCPEGFNKQPTSTFGKVYCENNELMFDPTSPTFQDDSLAYAKNYLTENFPTCNSVECPDPAVLLFGGVVILTPEYRSVYFECRSPYSTDYWEFQARLENGVVEKAVCTNIYLPPLTEEEKRAEFKRICEESISNQYCNMIFNATTSLCSTQEVFPSWDCSSSSQCTKGVSYSFESWNQGTLLSWNGCGYIAQKSWNNSPY